MALSIITTRGLSAHCCEQITTPWETQGITEEDLELAQGLGLLNQKINDFDTDFESMIEKEEFKNDEFNNEFEEFNQEVDRGIYGNSMFPGLDECINPSLVYRNIPVRVNKIWKTQTNGTKFAIGTIQTESNQGTLLKNTYFPRSMASKVTTGEMARVDLVYTFCQKNDWKVIYVHPKIQPEFISDIRITDTISHITERDSVCKTYKIPKQSIGHMVGKNGNAIQKIVTDYVHNNPKQIYVTPNKENDEKSVQMKWKIPVDFDITNENNVTNVAIWKNDEYPESSFKWAQQILNKMYC